MAESQLTVSDKLQTALELAGAGISMMRQNIVRRDPSLTADQIDERLQTWLMRREGSEFGDGPQELVVRAIT